MAGSVDNDVYDRLGGSWWDETSVLSVLHGSVTPGRFAYFRGVLARQFGGGLAGLRVPGGLYLFDTINRTRLSKLLAIKAAQQWPLTRLTDVAFHDWDMFIKPAELTAILERHGLTPGETTGLGARATPLAVLRSLAGARLGRITYGELSRRLDIGQVNSTAISYMGFATRQRSRPS
jgi:hypothetical protein